MLHFTCDFCGCEMGESRFVAKMEIYPAFDPEELDEGNLDSDHLQEISEIIAEMELSGDQQLEDCGAKFFRFDLCPECQRKFVKDPLGRDALSRLNFSEN